MSKLTSNPSGAFNRGSYASRSTTKQSNGKHHYLRNIAIATAALPLAVAAAPEVALAAGLPEAVATLNPVLGSQLSRFAASRIGRGWLAPAVKAGYRNVRTLSRMTRMKPNLVTRAVRTSFRRIPRRGPRIFGLPMRTTLGKRKAIRSAGSALKKLRYQMK